jgi:hypothetical protein
MKKKLCLVAAAALLIAFAACNAAPSGADTLTGSPEEILAQLKETTALELPMSLDSEVTAENAQNALGLTEAQFGEHVNSAYESQAAISTFAQSTVLVKCKSVSAATEVKKLVAGGFDSKKWVCVFPDQSLVVESGSYVLLAVGTAEETNALAEAFKTISGGNTGSPDVFFAFDRASDSDPDNGPDAGDGGLNLF